MQDKTMPDPGRMLDEMQLCVLCVLLAPAGSGLCSIEELGLAVGDREVAGLAVEGLHASGLVHRLEGFVFATRAAVRFRELDLLVVRPRA
jgi:hypothetical protein